MALLGNFGMRDIIPYPGDFSLGGIPFGVVWEIYGIIRPMAYVLQPLLKIRVMREDRASGELTAARRAVVAAQDALAARQKELDDFNETKEERRDRIYDAIIGHSVSRDRIDLAQEGVARIDEEGALKADNVAQAKNDLKRREEAAEVARANFVVATKNRMKIDEHKAVWIAAEAKEQEFRAEIELEDFIGKKLNVDD